MKWVEAVKVFNERKGGTYHVPRKGTAEYEEVVKIMGGDKDDYGHKEHRFDEKGVSSGAEVIRSKKIRTPGLGKEVDVPVAPSPESTLLSKSIRKVIRVGGDRGVLPMVYGKTGYKIKLESAT